MIAAAVTPRQRVLHRLGIFCGFTAALWLAGAEAPTKLVTVAVSPLIISFMMVLGAFISRWSLPALIRGTGDTFRDTSHVPHLIVWGVMAGCLWAVGNTLTIFAVRDIGLSLAFPLWNANSLIGIMWGTLLFKELHRAGWMRKISVVGGAVLIFVGAIFISAASTSEAAHGNALRGIAAALGAGLMFGSMYISYRKAYITGMNPLTFLTWFTFGEIITVTLLAVFSLGGVALFWHALVANRAILLWPMLGGFMWVVGDLFQNYAAKYVGISRGIPLSNTNQLWGLLWAVLVFHELHGLTAHIYAEVIGGSVIMVLGSLAIASSSASENEYASWQQAARRETDLYCIDPVYVASRGEGRELTSESADGKSGGRTWGDWLLVTVATLIFVALALIARVPHMEIQMGWLFVLTGAMFVALVGGCVALWRVTRFI
ncbi:MAG TPA: GRP family sugar transporter [Bryobacteraceae bacterium]|jgi:drug/metabolite transporter (DMT)-like permease|nr:GRP family sugar transporter [Bryobacteraceae bacterium]